MTTEIAVANISGMALAADSAVTVEQFNRNRIVTKVYNSANKLFTLSKWHPVGVMIYNATTLGGTPWETIIKKVRSELGNEHRPLLTDYAKFIFAKLDNNIILFPEKSVERVIFINTIRIIQGVTHQGQNLVKFKQAIEKRISKLEQVEMIDGFDDEFANKCIRDYGSQIGDALELSLKPSYRRSTKKLIEKLLALSFSRKECLSGYSGVVVCGFGEDEVFPSLVEFYSDIIVGGKVRFWKSTSCYRPRQSVVRCAVC